MNRDDKRDTLGGTNSDLHRCPVERKEDDKRCGGGGGGGAVSAVVRIEGVEK